MNETSQLHDYENSRAVVMGTWDYSFLQSVPAARNSFYRMLGMLTGSYCGWPEERVLTVSNESNPGALPDRLITAFDGIKDVALFYYVGHGQIDSDDELCLGLTDSRIEFKRRATTSLTFNAVRRALLNTDASTKIVILDCCFADLANRPASTLVGLADDLLDATAGTGAYTMAATSAYTTAWYETSSQSPQTYFTKYLVDLVEIGIPGQPRGLSLHVLFSRLRDRLVSDGLPTPHARSIDGARDFIFARNAAPPQIASDPEKELESIRKRLAEAEARLEKAAQYPQSTEQKNDEDSSGFFQSNQGRQHLNTNDAEQDRLSYIYSTDLNESASEQPTDQAVKGESALTAAEGGSTPEEVYPPGRVDAHSHSRWDLTKSREKTISGRRPISHRAVIKLCGLGTLALTVLLIWIFALPNQANTPRSTPTPRPSNRRTTKASAIAIRPTTPIANLPVPGNSIAFSPNGSVLAVAADNDVYLLNAKTYKQIASLPLSNDGFAGQAVAFSSNGEFLAADDGGSGTAIWSIATRRMISRPGTILTEGDYDVAFSKNGYLATADVNGDAYLWNQDYSLVSDLGSYDVNSLSFSADGNTLAGSSEYGDDIVYLWSGVTGSMIDQLPGSGPAEFSPQGSFLALVGVDGNSVRVWSMTTNKFVTTFTDPDKEESDEGSNSIDSIAFAPNGKMIAIGDADGNIYIWDMAAQKTRSIIHGATCGFGPMAFNPDGTLLACVSGQNTLIFRTNTE
jgi:WD40 repeat protein